MANSKKFVVKNGLETQNIQFVEVDGTETITLTVLEDGSLSFSGSSGQLFSIADSLTGTIFSVNDISGIPSIEVFDDGKVILAESTGNVGIGTASPTEKLEVSGTIKATALTLTGGLTVGGDLTINGTTTNINTTNLVVEDKNIILGDVTTPSDVTADGGGITLKGATDKTITWVDSTDRWTSNQVFGAPNFVSTVATGTQPYAATSTTVNTNLNADLLDGNHAAAFALSSHTHAISDVTNLQTTLDAKEPLDNTIIHNIGTITNQDWNTYIDGTEASWVGVSGHSGSNRPSSSYTYGLALNASTASAAKFQLYAPETGSEGNGLWYRTGWNTTYRAWVKIWDSGNDGASSGLDADLLDGNHASAFVLKAGDTMTGALNIQAGDATYGLSTALSLRLGLDTADKAGALRLDGTTDGAYGLIQETDSNLHIDAVGGKTYINYYDGDTVMFGNGASGVVAVMGPDGDLWKGSADNTGSVYWHAGNDGAGSGLDADLIDGISFRNGNSTNGINPDSINENGTGYITSVSLYGQTDGALYSQAYNTSWVHQIYGDYRTGSLAVRGRNNGTLTSWRTVWDSGNDGTGSTLDADLLDGQEGAYYLNYNNFTNTPTIPTVNDATLTLATSGTGLSGSATFTANDADNVTFTVTSNATNANTASTIVARDANKAFQVNKIYFANNAVDAYIAGDATDQYKIWFGSDVEGQSIYIDTLNQEIYGSLVGNALSASTAASVTNSVTFNNGGAGDASGTTYNGSAARTISYNTVGAAAASHTQAASTISDSTTIGRNFLTLANPSSVRFIRTNADNTISARLPVDFRGDISAMGYTSIQAYTAPISSNGTSVVNLSLSENIVAGRTYAIEVSDNATSTNGRFFLIWEQATDSSTSNTAGTAMQFIATSSVSATTSVVYKFIIYRSNTSTFSIVNAYTHTLGTASSHPIATTTAIRIWGIYRLTP